MDLAIYKNIDLTTACEIVGKVYAGNIGILGRYGITLGENATKEEAIAKLMEITKGQAEAYGKTFGGQLKILKEDFGDLQEQIGSMFIPILINVLEKIKPIIPKIMEWIKKHEELIPVIAGTVIALVGASGLTMAIGLLGMAIPKIIEGLGLLKIAFAALTSSGGIAILAIAALVAIGWYENWDKISGGFMAIYEYTILPMWEGMKNIWASIVNEIIKSIKLLKDAFLAMWEDLKEAFKRFIELWVGDLNRFKEKLEPIVNWLKEALSFIAEQWGKFRETGFGRWLIGPVEGKQTGGYISETKPYLLHRGETVIPAGRIAGINITITGNTFIGERDFADRIGDILFGQLKLNAKI
jgi:hypothetical protein